MQNKKDILIGIGEVLIKMLGNFVDHINVAKDELTIYVYPESITSVIYFLKHHTNTKCNLLIDICGVDYIQRANRFEVVYHLLSTQTNLRVRVKVLLNESESINSITSIHKGANWFEREVWDMFGIFFKNHPDLRRILTDYGFEGHPLRKDFPLTGYSEVYYDDEKKTVVSRSMKHVFQ